MTTHWKSKEARQLDYMIDLAFATGRIKEDTHKAGKSLTLTMEMRARNADNADVLRVIGPDIADKRAAFDDLSGTIDDERRLHRRFARLRVNGEWFSATNEIKNFIIEAAKRDGAISYFTGRPDLASEKTLADYSDQEIAAEYWRRMSANSASRWHLTDAQRSEFARNAANVRWSRAAARQSLRQGDLTRCERGIDERPS